jgi:hypothetical protein
MAVISNWKTLRCHPNLKNTSTSKDPASVLTSAPMRCQHCEIRLPTSEAFDSSIASAGRPIGTPGDGSRCSGLSSSCVLAHTVFVHDQWQHPMKRKGNVRFHVCDQDTSHHIYQLPGRELKNLSEDLAGCSARLDGGHLKLSSSNLPSHCCPCHLQPVVPKIVNRGRPLILHRGPRAQIPELELAYAQ